MNERIRQLAEQAGAEYSDFHSVSLLDKEIEVFAELIVRECVSAINEMHRYARSTDAKRVEEATIQDCIRAVREQFGVEE